MPIGTYAVFPLNMDQEITMFEILDIPFTSKGYTVTDNIGTLRSAVSTQPAVVILKDIEDYLGSNVSPVNDASWIARLVGYIADWNTLGTSVTRVETGNIGDVTGVTDKPNEERELIRDRVRNMVPFYTRYVWLQKMEGTGGGTIPVMR